MFSEPVVQFIAQQAEGDARAALNLVDACSRYIQDQEEKEVTIDHVKNLTAQRFIQYDKKGENHYNTISALHKSLVCLC